MDIILIPGLWLDGSSWERVVPALEKAGHRPHPLTLPGMTRGADHSDISTAEIVDAVVAAIDSADGQVLLVGHSAGCAIATAAVDARPDRVARVLYVGGFPGADGKPVAGGFPVEDGGIPFPAWSDLGEEDLRDLDDAGPGRVQGPRDPVARPAHHRPAAAEERPPVRRAGDRRLPGVHRRAAP